LENIWALSSVVTVAGICNLLGGVFFDVPPRCLCWWRWRTRLRWLMGNRWMSRLRVPVVLECANCSLHSAELLVYNAVRVENVTLSKIFLLF